MWAEKAPYVSYSSLEELSKKWLETRDNDVFYELKALIQDNMGGPSVQQRVRMVEDYKNGSATLHIHIIRYQACIAVKRNCDRSSKDRIGERHYQRTSQSGDLKSEIGLVRDCEQDGPVLIEVAELVECGEGVIERLPIRSEAWLQSLNQCQCFSSDSSGMIFPSIPPSSRRRANGKLEIDAVAPWFPDPDEAANQIVECGTHIVDAIPENSAGMDRWPGIVRIIDDPRCARRSIDLWDHYVLYGFLKIVNFSAEEIEMFACSKDFGVYALHPRQRVRNRHAFTLTGVL